MGRAARYVGHAAVSGVVGWLVLMSAFEGYYWGSSYMTHLRRKWAGRMGTPRLDITAK